MLDLGVVVATVIDRAADLSRTPLLPLEAFELETFGRGVSTVVVVVVVEDRFLLALAMDSLLLTWEREFDIAAAVVVVVVVAVVAVARGYPKSKRHSLRKVILGTRY